MQSAESSEIGDTFLYEANSMSHTELTDSDVWADVQGDENLDDGGVDLFGNMDTSEVDSLGNMDELGGDVFMDTETGVFENTECVSNDDTVEHVESSSLENVESSSPKNVESYSLENVESSSLENVKSPSPENVESSSPENVESSSPENVKSSSPEHVSLSSYAATLMSKKNYKGVMSPGIAKKSIVANKHKQNITIDDTMMESVSIEDMKNLTNLDIKYNASGEIIQMYEGCVGKIYRVYDPEELYFDKRTGDTRTLTAAELCASRKTFKRVEKNRDDAKNHRGTYNAKMAVLFARIAVLEDENQKLRASTGLAM